MKNIFTLSLYLFFGLLQAQEAPSDLKLMSDFTNAIIKQKSNESNVLIRKVISISSYAGDLCVFDIEGEKCWRHEKGFVSVDSISTSTAINIIKADQCYLSIYQDESMNIASCPKRRSDISMPAEVEGVTEIVSGFRSYCVIKQSKVTCFPDNGISSEDRTKIGTPPNLVNPKNLSANFLTTCVLDEDAVKCWGENAQYFSRAAKDLKHPQFLSVGSNDVCVIDNDGVKCWGKNSEANAKINSLVGLKNPKRLSHDISQYSANLCALDDDGLKCLKDGKYVLIIGLEEFGDVDFDKIKFNERSACFINSDKVKCKDLVFSENSSEYLILSDSYKAKNIFSSSCLLKNGKLNCSGILEDIKFLNNNFSAISDFSSYIKSITSDTNRVHTFGTACIGSGKSIFCGDFNVKNYGPPIVEIKTFELPAPIQQIALSKKNNQFCALTGKEVICAYPSDGSIVWRTSLDRPLYLVNDENTQCALDLFGLSCKWGDLRKISFNFSDYFYQEKAVPLIYAKNVIKKFENSKDFNSLLILENQITNNFLTGVNSDSLEDISLKVAAQKDIYKALGMYDPAHLSLRNSTQLRFVLDIIRQSLVSSKKLLSNASKKNIDKMLPAFSQILSEEEVTIAMASEILGEMYQESELLSEMQSSYRLVGFRSFYDWANNYVKTGKIE